MGAAVAYSDMPYWTQVPQGCGGVGGGLSMVTASRVPPGAAARMPLGAAAKEVREYQRGRSVAPLRLHQL